MKSKKTKRMSARKVKKAIALCISRDGRRCNICKRFLSEDQCILDHNDNNPENNPKDGSNWQILCKRDNYKKNPRGKNKKEESSIIERPRASTIEMVTNLRAEPAFRHWLFEYLRKHNKIEEETAINMGAEVAHCSPITTRRYLVKCCSDAGFAFISYDQSAECNFIYLRTKTMQPVTADYIDDQEIPL